MNRTRLKVQLVQHEDRKTHPYTDTAGNLTIGVGRNLTDRGLRDSEIAFMLDNDIDEAHAICTQLFPGFATLSESRQHALIDMAFNLGEPRLRKFVKMKAAVDARDFDRAAAEILDSKLPERRKTTLAGMMKGDA